MVDGLNQPGLGAIMARPLRVRCQPNVKLDVEKAGRIRAVVGPAQFRGDRGDFRKGVQDLPHLGSDLCRFIERNGVGHRRAHPQRAFVELRHELRADAGNEQQRTHQQNRRSQCRTPGMRQAKIKAPDVGRFDGFKSGVAPLPHATAHEP